MLNNYSTNPNIETANNCAHGPVPINAPNGSDHDCVLLCVNKDAKLINIRNNENVFFEQKLLPSGMYCKLGSVPNCNTRTSYTLLTLNSILCRSRYPEIFGGESENQIIACNNESINDALNVLWDRKQDIRITAKTVPKSFDPNEILLETLLACYIFTKIFSNVAKGT